MTADLLDALPPPVLKRLLVIVLCYFGLPLAFVLAISAVLYLFG
jgi:hypothetical protein